MNRKYTLAALGVFLMTGLFPAISSGTSDGAANIGKLNDALAPITVTNTNDSGPGSLRQAIADAAPGTTINFNVTGTITLTTGQLLINKNLTISGPGADHLAISGNDLSSVFSVNTAITATLDGITIKNGTGPLGLDGAAIASFGALTIINSVITQNTAGISGGGSVTLIDTHITQNEGVGMSGVGSVTVNNSTISVNGGSGLSRVGGSQIIYNSTIADNAGAGIFGDAGCWTPPELSIMNSTISGNRGTGVMLVDGLAQIANSTIVNNEDGGIMSYDDCWGGGGIVKLWNTIVAGNTVNGGPAEIREHGIAAASHNLIGHSPSSGGIQNGVNGNIVGINPRLGALQNNGGPTMTHSLRLHSRAVNAGDRCVLTENGCGYTHPAVPTDQRGMPRNGSVDIGAFEQQRDAASPYDPILSMSDEKDVFENDFPIFSYRTF